MISVYYIFSVALPEAKLALLEILATLIKLTWLLEEQQKKYYIQGVFFDWSYENF